jgi:hypothetical protein
MDWSHAVVVYSAFLSLAVACGGAEDSPPTDHVTGGGTEAGFGASTTNERYTPSQ